MEAVISNTLLENAVHPVTPRVSEISYCSPPAMQETNFSPSLEEDVTLVYIQVPKHLSPTDLINYIPHFTKI